MKRFLKKSLAGTKKVANSNKYSRRVAQGLKKGILSAVSSPDQREIYNLGSFYPTIQDYYGQTRDLNENDPLISILMPTYNTPEAYLRDCIESIIIQSYPNWELCVADDSSSDKKVVAVIKEYRDKDPRIKLVERGANGHISEASNSALEIARGEFVGLMDHDDVLWPNALYEVVKVIRNNRRADFIYSDEDKIDTTGEVHSYPFLKPDFSPEFLESCNFITHFSCIRTSVIKEVGGFRKGYEGAQDWDLFMRISEKTDKIVHIPKILYSWRIHEASTASDTDAKPYVYEAQKNLLVDHVSRLGKKGEVVTGIIKQHRTIKYEPAKGSAATVVIDYENAANAKRLIESLKAHDAGLRFDVLCLHSPQMTSGAKENLRTSALGLQIEFLPLAGTDNKYKLAAAKAREKYLIFAEDSVEINSDQWAKTFVADSQIEGVGIVSPVLLDTDKATIRSAGVGIGYGERGYADMLHDMPFDDPHYSRGLYSKSRRNVSAVNPALFATTKGVILSADKSEDIIGLCLDLLDKGYRHVYTPYVQAILHGTVWRQQPVVKAGREDRYLNPNFNHSNQKMEVKA